MLELVEATVDRCAAAEDLDDFLLWWGGTLEYWVHVIASGVGNRAAAWAARSEVPYVTGSPALSSKTDVKWADGAIVWDDGLLALLEVKSIPMRHVLGSSAQHIPRDLAALASADWTRSLAHARGTDTYTDEAWWERRTNVRAAWGVAIGLVHGRKPLTGAVESFEAALLKGQATLRNRHVAERPPWLDAVDRAFASPLMARRPIEGATSEAVVYAWATPVFPVTS